jgi:hypothetical protein
MAEKRTTILPVSEKTKENISKLSAESLPINPSAKGMKPEEVKRAFYAPIIDESTSILAELQRIIGEANEVYGYILDTIGNMEHLYETDGYENLVAAIIFALEKLRGNDTTLGEHTNLISEIQKKIDNNEALKTKAKSFLEAINENYDKIVANEQYRNMFANALKGKVIGNPVTFNDVDISPLAHDSLCKLESKNLFDVSKISNTDSIVNNGDGSLSVSTYSNPTKETLRDLCPTLKVGDVITISAETDGSNFLLLGGKSVTYGANITITDDILKDPIFLYGKHPNNSVDLSATISKIQIERGKVATTCTSYIKDFSDIEVTVTTGEGEPTTYTAEKNGRVTISSVTKDTVITSIPDVVIEAEYNIDTNVVPRDYVKRTDYASYSDYGVVKINSTYYGLMLYSDNTLGINKAAEKDINSRTSARPIVPENLDYAIKAALSDCKITWTEGEKNAVKDLLGLWWKGFKTLQNEGETITLSNVDTPYAQISEIHGMDSDYNSYESYYTAVKNYPKKIITDKDNTVFELPNDVLSRLADFGIRGNYIYFDNGKAFYHQACRAGSYDEQYNLGEGETLEHVISDTMSIIKLKEPVVTDISEHITSDGIINIGNAEYLTVVPLVTEEDVEGMVSPEGMHGDYHFNFPTVKIIVES